MGMTKKQAKEKIEPLEVEIQAIKNDLLNLKHPETIHAIKSLIEHKESVLKMYKRHANIPSARNNG